MGLGRTDAIRRKLAVVPSVPRLYAVTRRLPERVDLLSFADPDTPLVWLRDDRGFVGVGEVLRLTATGPRRFRDLADAWQRVSEAADVDDAVHLPGSGLLALGAVTFADESTETSVLIVPQTLVHRHDEAWFLTEIERIDPGAASVSSRAATLAKSAPEARLDLLPPVAAVTAWPGVPIDPSLDGAAADDYLSRVTELERRIDAGEAQKVVFARSITAPVPPGADLRIPLGRLAERYLTCWTFSIDGILGATPETLIRVIAGTASALVLAGTAPRIPDDPVADDAERRKLETTPHIDEEHRFAAESVISTLTPLTESLTASEGRRVIRLPNVWHRATAISAEVAPERSALELVEAMFPTAAIAGTPTPDAQRMIAELEPHDRGRYAGAVGWIDAAGDGEWAIALRCAQIADGSLTAWAGGGIVAGSHPGIELAETVLKFQPISEAFR